VDRERRLRHYDLIHPAWNRCHGKGLALKICSADEALRRDVEDCLVVVVEGDDEFKRLVCSKPLAVAMFSSPMCPACEMYRPMFREAARIAKSKLGDRIIFVEADVMTTYEVAMELGILSTPTTVVFRNCRPVDGFVGPLLPEDLVEIVLEHVPR
jgi:thiol-disulfide isomerase/thioredoxin